MMKAFERMQKVVSSILVGSMFCFSESAFAAPAPPVITPQSLPGSVLPERAATNIATQPVGNPQALPPIAQRGKPQQTSLGPAAEKIKFKLNKIILQDNHVYSTAELSKLYQDKIGKTITVSELQNIVQDITNYYRNNGYILSRAVLPPQHVADGLVYIKIIEGYIDKVTVVGNPKGARPLIQAYGDHISAIRPITLKDMEHYLLLSNEISGVQVKAVLEPSKSNIGASNLNLVADTRSFSSYLSYDNYGTRYIGPTEGSGGAEMDSIFRPGDSTQLNFVRTTRGQELQFFQLLYNTPIGSEGMRFILNANQALTQPGLNLAILKIMGNAVTFTGTLQYPVIRSRTHNLTWEGILNYTDSYVTTLQPSVALYTDHLRTFRTGLNFDITDEYGGANSAQAHVETGLTALGGTTETEGNAVPQLTSRFGASNHFFKSDFQLSRLQQFGASRFSLFAILTGQYAMEPLLATEQFGFGGVQQGLGRGYDPAEIIGDRGLAGSIELRMNIAPQRFLLQAAQLYTFYDAGEVWDLKTIADQNTKESATSTGFGSRFYFTKYLSGNFLWAQPLSKVVAAQDIIGDGRQPRVFFSITAAT
jgi:hemolysin activation/secretion protein